MGGFDEGGRMRIRKKSAYCRRRYVRYRFGPQQRVMCRRFEWVQRTHFPQQRPIGFWELQLGVAILPF
jgi:hypothetical protein